MTIRSGDTLSRTSTDLFGDLQIPPALDESIYRHRAHLAHLVSSLHSAGFSEKQIDESVSLLVASYKEERIRTIKTMVR